MLSASLMSLVSVSDRPCLLGLGPSRTAAVTNRGASEDTAQNKTEIVDLDEPILITVHQLARWSGDHGECHAICTNQAMNRATKVLRSHGLDRQKSGVIASLLTCFCCRNRQSCGPCVSFFQRAYACAVTMSPDQDKIVCGRSQQDNRLLV